MKGIYKITNVVDGKVYIGQTQNLINRKRNHFYWLGRNSHHNDHLQKTFNKYGKDKFIFEIIEETDDLDNKELYWLNENGGLNSNKTYNLKGPKTKEWSNYVKVKQSKSMLGENNPMWGKPTTTRKPILKLNKNGEIIKEYEFLTQVKEDGYNPSNVMYCANGIKGYKKSKGFYWKWKE
jgi:group I intron endonuclease